VIVNRVLPELFNRDEEAAFDLLDTPAGRAALSGVVGSGAEAVIDAARLAADLRRSRAVHLERLAGELPNTIPLIMVPYLFTRMHGIRVTRQVADLLGEEIL